MLNQTLLMGASAYRSGASGADPYFANVISLLHCDGANGSTTITDVTGKTWSAVGGAQISTAQSQFGGASLLLSGSGDYVSCTHAVFSDFDTSTMWTAESWVRLDALAGAAQVLFCMGDAMASYFQCLIDATNGLRINKYGVDILNQGGTAGISAGAFMHIAFERDGTNLYGFVDGILRASSANGAAMPTLTSQTMLVGANVVNPASFAGHLDDIRITKNVARYTSSGFSVPAEAFPDS